MSDYADLIRPLLPDDISVAELLAFAPEELRAQSPRQALLQAVAKYPRINWDAYLARNPDVEAAGLDPRLHFLRDGMHEGRRLYSWHPLKEEEAKGAPLVSVIVVIYNNSPYLRKCLESALRQTLRAIEVIAVNDASTDDSLAIIQSLAKRDPRLKIVDKQKNGGIVAAKKSGVLAASGRYLMFSDGDDFLAPDACEIGYREIRKGYDIVQAGANIVNITREVPVRAAHCAKSVNAGKIKEYKGSEISEEMFVKRSLVWPLWSKIILRELAVAGYSDLEDGYFVGAEDTYAMAAIASKARNLLRIDAKFYNYIYGTGISTLNRVNKAYRLWFNHGETIKALGKYAKKRSLNIGFKQLAETLCSSAISKWATDVPAHDAHEYFELIKSQYGLECVLDTLLKHWSYRSEKVAAKFIHCRAPRMAKKEVETIGLVVKLAEIGEARDILAALARLKRFKRIIVYLDGGMGAKWDLPEGLEAVALESANPKDRAFELLRIIQADPPDLLLYFDKQERNLLTDLVIFSHFGIPAIIVYLGDFCLPYLEKLPGYPHAWHELAMASASAVACFAKTTELYLRERGVNAWALPAPQPVAKRREKPEYDLAFIIAASTTEEEARDLVAICEAVAGRFHWLSALIIDSGASASLKKDLRDAIREAGLAQNITLTNAGCDPAENISRARIFVSACAWDGIGRNLALARAAGMVCVIYDLPNDLQNCCALKVAKGDVKGAAGIISELLANEAALGSLEALAKGKAGRPDQFGRALANMIDNFQRLAPVGAYGRRDYEKIIKFAALSFSQNVEGEMAKNAIAGNKR